MKTRNPLPFRFFLFLRKIQLRGESTDVINRRSDIVSPYSSSELYCGRDETVTYLLVFGEDKEVSTGLYL